MVGRVTTVDRGRDAYPTSVSLLGLRSADAFASGGWNYSRCGTVGKGSRQEDLERIGDD